MRADIYLYENKYVESRARAKLLITGGAVIIDGHTVTKPAYDVSCESEHTVVIHDDICPYVSVGGLKLQAALDRFDFNVDGLVCADIGASTGGFTDCLLSRGAARVYTIDSGTEQLHEKLRSDIRVIAAENVNARYINESTLPERCSLAVCDVSFISLRLILPALCKILSDDAHVIALIKPQFELDRTRVGKGVVSNPDDRAKAVYSVLTAAADCGLIPVMITLSPVSGGGVSGKAGNREYPVLFKKNNKTVQPPAYGAIGEYIRNEKNRDTAVWYKEQ